MMLQDSLPPGIATKDQLKKMRRIIDFCALVYTLWWYQCPIASAASRLDLEFVEAIKAIESIDLKLAQAALKVFKRHTWYLHGEMIPLALWDKHLHDNVKAVTAQKILEQPTDADDPSSKTFVGRHGTGFGKPDLLAINDQC